MRPHSHYPISMSNPANSARRPARYAVLYLPATARETVRNVQAASRPRPTLGRCAEYLIERGYQAWADEQAGPPAQPQPPAEKGPANA